MLLSVSRIFGRVFGLGILIFALWFSLVSHLFGPIPASEGTILTAIFAVVVLHELLHAAVALILGARRLSAGVWKKWVLPLGLYVSIGDELPVVKWLAVALAPLSLSPASLLLASLISSARDLLVWISVVNAAGSAGDVALSILAAGAGQSARVRDRGVAIEIEGGEPAQLSWVLLNASASLGYAILCSFIALQLLTVVAFASGKSIELLGIKLVEVVRNGGRVTARATPGYALLALAAGLAAATAVALRSVKRRQPTYTSSPPS